MFEYNYLSCNGNAEKEKSKKPESADLTLQHVEAFLAHIKFLKPHNRHTELKQDIWIEEPRVFQPLPASQAHTVHLLSTPPLTTEMIAFLGTTAGL